MIDHVIEMLEQGEPVHGHPASDMLSIVLEARELSSRLREEQIGFPGLGGRRRYVAAAVQSR